MPSIIESRDIHFFISQQQQEKISRKKYEREMDFDVLMKNFFFCFRHNHRHTSTTVFVDRRHRKEFCVTRWRMFLFRKPSKQNVILWIFKIFNFRNYLESNSLIHNMKIKTFDQRRDENCLIHFNTNSG